MATLRERPYPNFNFLVDLGTGETDGPDGGFEEVILPDLWVEVIEYRNGNDKENEVRKLTGLSRCGNVILKRGVVGSLTLYQWYNQVRNGAQNALRTVTIELRNEDHTQTVQVWKLLRARIVRLRWGSLHARGKDVTVEEIELAVERVELE